MKNENVVVYNNDMNLVPLRSFTSSEQDLLYSICIKMRDKGQSILKLSFDEIKKLCNYNRKDVTIDNFAKELNSVYSKLLAITCAYTEGRKYKGFVLFTSYEIDPDTQIAEIKINEDFSYLLNDLTSNFTKFEMLEFSSLRSSYSKTAYRILKQYRKTGYLILKIDDFKEKFCIPKSYQMCDIDKRVLNFIQRELKPYIKSLEINKLSKGKGKKITHIEFIFMPEDDFKENGKKTFRNKDGLYYEKSFSELTLEEIDKEYPKVPRPQAKKYFQCN